MANISIRDLETCADLDIKARTEIRGGAFGVFGFILPFESIGRSKSGGSTFNILNILADRLVINNITNTSVLDVDISEVTNSSVTVEAPQLQLGSTQTTLTELLER